VCACVCVYVRGRLCKVEGGDRYVKDLVARGAMCALTFTRECDVRVHV